MILFRRDGKKNGEPTFTYYSEDGKAKFSIFQDQDYNLVEAVLAALGYVIETQTSPHSLQN